MPRYMVKVEVHKYQDLSDRAAERWLPIEASSEEDAVYKMRELLDDERRKDAEASGVSEASGVALYEGKGTKKQYVGRVLMGHAKLAGRSGSGRSQRAQVPEEEPTDFREVTVGTSVPSHRVTPRIVSPKGVARFKNMWGVCTSPGCVKIAGHDGGKHT
jgi:hypothetical protein